MIYRYSVSHTQLPDVASLLPALQQSDLSLPLLGSSLQTCPTCQCAQSSSGSVWPAAALRLARFVPPRQTHYPPLRHSADTQVANTCRHTHTHTDMHKHTYTATHLLIPVSLIPRHSPQIFPSADLIVRECVCVYISGVVGGVVQQGLPQMPGSV